MIIRLNKGAKQENHKDEIKLITPPCNNEGSGGIIDVEFLPNKWKGTPVPNNGYVDKIYFNTNLSSKEVNKLIDIIRENMIDGDETYYPIVADNPDSSIGKIFIIDTYDYRIYEDQFSEFFYKDNSWKISNNSYLIQSNVYLEDISGNEYGKIGYLNNIISSLVSTTPFEKADIDPNSIYRLPDGTLWMLHNGAWKELGNGGSSDLIDVQYELNVENTDSFEYGKIYRQIRKISDTHAIHYIAEDDIHYITDPDAINWGTSIVLDKLPDVNTITEETTFTDIITGNIYNLHYLIEYPFIAKSENKVYLLYNDGDGNNPYYIQDYIEYYGITDPEDLYYIKGYKVITSLDEMIESGYIYIKYGDIIEDQTYTMQLVLTDYAENGRYLKVSDGIVNVDNLDYSTITSNESTQYVYPSDGYYALSRVKIEPGTKSNRTDFTKYYISSSITEINLIDTSNATTMDQMFYNCQRLKTLPLLDTRKVTNMSYMFNHCKKLIELPPFITTNVTSMSSMLSGCDSLKSIPLLDTSNVTTMHSMFTGCDNLESIPQLNTNNVTTMNSMFSGCIKLTTIPLLNTNNVTSMISMFRDCSALTTIPLLDTSNVTTMNSMFYNCNNLTSIPHCNVSKVTNLEGMFAYCYSLKSILMYGMKVKFDISASTQFEQSDLVTILNNLGTVTSNTTLTMGSTNLAKLTNEDKAIATAKGWTLA